MVEERCVQKIRAAGYMPSMLSLQRLVGQVLPSAVLRAEDLEEKAHFHSEKLILPARDAFNNVHRYRSSNYFDLHLSPGCRSTSKRTRGFV